MRFCMQCIKTKILLTAVVFGAFSLPFKLQAENSYFGPVKSDDYLSGKFKPHSHVHFSELGKMGIPTGKRKQFLRSEAAEALLEMYSAFHKEHPDVPFWVQSSTRNYWDQKNIWEKKWNGQTKVGGRKLNVSIPDSRKRALKILEFSSMPGTSRHHWGTDFDLNELYNSYYEKGKGALLFLWLEKNAEKFGFCRPYTSGRNSGYSEEKWHWSYRPLSSRFLILWNNEFKKNTLNISGFAGGENAQDLATIYVNSISSDCK